MFLRRRTRGSLSLTIRVSMVLCALVAVSTGLTPVVAAGSTYCVAPTNVSTTAPCANPAAFTDIQSAVDAASTGDEIRVAAGTYTAPNASRVVSIFSKVLSIRGGYTTTNWATPTATTPTIIDGQDARPGVLIFQTSDVTFERVTITHGHDTGSGGGAINANIFPPTGRGLNLIDVIITNNSSTGSGGGLFVTGGATNLTRTQVTNKRRVKMAGDIMGCGSMPPRVRLYRTPLVVMQVAWRPSMFRSITHG